MGVSVFGVREFCGWVRRGWPWSVGRPWGRRGRAEGHVTQRQPATGSLRTMPQQKPAEAGPKAATAGEMDMDRAAKTAKTSSAALLLLCAPPLGGRRARRSAWRVAAGRHPSRPQLGTYTRHDTPRHATTRPDLLTRTSNVSSLTNHPNACVANVAA
jgi:hypothetical protein